MITLAIGLMIGYYAPALIRRLSGEPTAFGGHATTSYRPRRLSLDEILEESTCPCPRYPE